jgi:hypothetical protein
MVGNASLLPPYLANFNKKVNFRSYALTKREKSELIDQTKDINEL